MAAPRPLILVVDDDEGVLTLMANQLLDDGYRVVTADSGPATLAQLYEHTPDLLLLDLKLKDVAAPALLRQLRAEGRLVPFIVVSGQGDERAAVEIMKQGALDYLIKDSTMLERLPAVVQRAWTAVQRDRELAAAARERQRLEQEILEATEREQHRIGEDLHDGLGQQLTAIEMLCTALKADVATREPELARRIDRIGGMLREAVAQTRSMARGLVPVKDEPDALWASLVELADRTSALGRVKCRLDCPRPVLVPDNLVAGHLYRIAQEAVNNAVKHSGASEIVLRFTGVKGGVELQVSDNGRGLPAAGPTGLGLRVMRHRAKVIGADLDVASKPGRGVTITCTWREPARAHDAKTTHE